MTFFSNSSLFRVDVKKNTNSKNPAFSTLSTYILLISKMKKIFSLGPIFKNTFILYLAKSHFEITNSKFPTFLSCARITTQPHIIMFIVEASPTSQRSNFVKISLIYIQQRLQYNFTSTCFLLTWTIRLRFLNGLQNFTTVLIKNNNPHQFTHF